jgi:Mg-chelatase subunit ChlD
MRIKVFTIKTKKMEKELTFKKEKETSGQETKHQIHNLIILDESGSMSSIANQIVSGFNELVQTIQSMEKDDPEHEHFVTFIMFEGGNIRTLLFNQPASKLHPFGANDYRPGAMTPLYDAIGTGLTKVKPLVEANVNNKALVTIMTDGLENASREYSGKQIQKMIDELKKKDWTFTYIGTEHDVDFVAQNLHINNVLQFQKSEEDMQRMWMKEKMGRRNYQSKMNRGENFRENYYENPQQKRTTPFRVISLQPNEIFVFGSNSEGKHYGGAAALAAAQFGAVQGQAEGLQGQSYAIPTVGVSLMQIKDAVFRFAEFARSNSDKTFLVTEIGCGNGGYSPEEIAPLFRYAAEFENIHLPESFWSELW